MTTKHPEELAAYLTGEGRGVEPATVRAEIARRWPGIASEDLAAGVALAKARLRAEAADHFTEADALGELATAAAGLDRAAAALPRR